MVIKVRILYWIGFAIFVNLIGFVTFFWRSSDGLFVAPDKEERAAKSTVLENLSHTTGPVGTSHAYPTGQPHSMRSTKLVLFWTLFFGKPDPRSMQGAELFKGCPISDCLATGERKLLDRSQAVMFHGLDISNDDLPPPRRPGQHYIFSDGESPENAKGIERTPENFFDMTQTYRLDSDVRGHYVYSVSLAKEPRDFAKGKTKLVAWFVSNCQTASKREDYVRELEKFIPVDIYGVCGKLHCPRKTEEACFELLRKDYKFYLAFENSICQDYVTEKFTNALQNDVVPVVLGAGNMTIFPPNSYIHVDNFPSAKALALYLQKLDGDSQAYNEYMKWRYDPQLVQSHGEYSAGNSSWCQLCERLHDPDYRPTGYPDARQWFMDGGHCRHGSY